MSSDFCSTGLCIVAERVKRSCHRFIVGFPHLESQHSEEVFRSIGQATFYFGTKLSEGATRERGKNGAAAEVALAENVRGTLAD